MHGKYVLQKIGKISITLIKVIKILSFEGYGPGLNQEVHL